MNTMLTQDARVKPISRRLTVGVTTRNRPESLARCVGSLGLIAPFVREVVVVDDCSDPPVESPLRAALGADFPISVTVVRHNENQGYIVARNQVAALAEGDLVLNLDDDTQILDPAAVRRAVDVMDRDPGVAAVAFAQAEADGRAWPAAMQPAPVDYPCVVPSFIGFAALLRRDLFLSLGGYRELFHFYGEEKEYCLRALAAGYVVVFLPDARIAHLPDSGGRDRRRYLRYVIRNDLLNALYNDPLTRLPASVAFRVFAYFRLKRQLGLDDAGGLRWILREVRTHLPAIWRDRRPLKWATFGQWRRLRKVWPPYPARTGGRPEAAQVLTGAPVGRAGV